MREGGKRRDGGREGELLRVMSEQGFPNSLFRNCPITGVREDQFQREEKVVNPRCDRINGWIMDGWMCTFV